MRVNDVVDHSSDTWTRQKTPQSSSDDVSILSDAVDRESQLDAETNKAMPIYTNGDDDLSHNSPGLLRELETRNVTVSQLTQEVNGIYAGLGMYLLLLYRFILLTVQQ